MFAYDINTADIFVPKSAVNWDDTNLPYSLKGLQGKSVDPTFNKVGLATLSPISPPTLPPSAFTQVSSSNSWTDAWNPTPQTAFSTPTSPLLSDPVEEHLVDVSPSKQNLYKTELCRNWMETRQCRYGPKCQFAHGEDELRDLLRHPKYKTEICRSYHTSAKCAYGNRCRFVHHASEMRTADGAPLEDNGYAFQQQLAQLKFVDIMPSPNQSLFSSPSIIPKNWFTEVDKLMGDMNLNATNAPTNQHNISTVQTRPSISMLSDSDPNLDSPNTEPTATVAKVFSFIEDECDTDESFSNDEEESRPKKNKSRLGFFQKLYKTDKKRS
jgi:butyrate response factor 1